MDEPRTIYDLARKILDHAFFMTIVGFYSDRVEDAYGEMNPIQSIPSRFLDDAELAIERAVKVNLFLTNNDLLTAICHSIMSMNSHIERVWRRYDESTREGLVAAALTDQTTIH